MSQPVTKPVSMNPEAVRQREHRDRLRRIESLEAEVTVLRSDKESFKAVVEQFTVLNEGLKVKLAEVESKQPAIELAEKILADSDLKFLVESMWLKSEFQRDRFKSQVSTYRQSLKS